MNQKTQVKQTLSYDQIIAILTSLGKTVDRSYTVIDAEDDYKADPVGRMRIAETVKGKLQ